MEKPPETGVRVEVVHATSSEQLVIELRVPPGTSVHDAVERSGLLERISDVRPFETPVGIFGRRVTWDQAVHDGDRIELYRPLIIDPKEARRKRARAGSRGPA